MGSFAAEKLTQRAQQLAAAGAKEARKSYEADGIYGVAKLSSDCLAATRTGSMSSHHCFGVEAVGMELIKTTPKNTNTEVSLDWLDAKKMTARVSAHCFMFLGIKSDMECAQTFAMATMAAKPVIAGVKPYKGDQAATATSPAETGPSGSKPTKEAVAPNSTEASSGLNEDKSILIWPMKGQDTVSVSRFLNFHGSCGANVVAIIGVEGDDGTFSGVGTFTADTESADLIIRKTGGSETSYKSLLSDQNRVSCVSVKNQFFLVVGSRCSGSKCNETLSYNIIDTATGNRHPTNESKTLCDFKCVNKRLGTNFRD